MKFICNYCGEASGEIPDTAIEFFNFDRVDLNRRFGIPYDNRLRFFVKCPNCDSKILIHAIIEKQELIEKGQSINEKA